ncbi:hypothetical protein EUX98_g761 [Antrodiella citrinella]|uniref:KN homeodomain domain-containing protein n=1 Tax=Antrodiella citrinella TaxID=2447956 RepID=A0A4S4NBU2_9APHY|nr:hypothetical protein EUX98_g761 [Antrodiella citrinella]
MDINALRTRLREAPFQFLSAVSSSTLLDFHQEWRSLHEDADKALQLSLLDDEDVSLVHATATLLATIGEHLLRAEERSAKTTASFVDEVEDVFARLTISDIHETLPSPIRTRTVHRPSSSIPSYNSAAYAWISQNLHNPYPSSEVKKRISRDAGRPLRVITDWFKDVRRHIGWVAMCKTHFQGSRALAVQIATHVYLHTNTTPHLSPDIVSQFEAIPSFNLDDAPVSLGKRKNHTEEDEWRQSKRKSVANGMVEDVTPPAPTALSSAVSDSPLPTQHIPSRKRRFSIGATDGDFTGSTPSVSSPTCDPRPLLIPKRRLSVSDSQPASKRPCLPPAVGPRKQAVSTPIPIAFQSTSNIDDWYRTFELPDTSLSVELFNWDLVVENDAFPYSSLFDNILQSDGQDLSNLTPSTDAYQSPTPLDLDVSSAVDPSILGISSAFTEPPPTQLTAPISTPPGPITATTTPVFDFLDAFLSAVNADSAEPHTTPSSSPSAELSLNDTIDLFGESVVMP